jgi:predicted GNAT family acetyltransferase
VKKGIGEKLMKHVIKFAEENPKELIWFNENVFR